MADPRDVRKRLHGAMFSVRPFLFPVRKLYKMKLQKITTKKTKPLKKKNPIGHPLGQSTLKSRKKCTNVDLKELSKKKERHKYTPPKANSTTTKHNKIRLIKGLFENFGLVTQACRAAGVSRQCYYEYMRHDPEFKNEVDTTITDAVEMALDFTEGKLMNLVNDKEFSAICFFLKCKGKRRGYVEQTNIGILNDTGNQKMIVAGQEVVF